MIKKRLIAMNAALSVLQVLFTGGMLFLLYRFLLETIGVERLGVWSLILATTSLTNIANLGITGSVVKFVARYHAKEEPGTIARLIHTSVATTAVSIGVFTVVFYFFAGWIIGLVVPEGYSGEAMELLPYALASLWLNAVGGVFLSGIDGFQYTFVRSILLMAGFAAYLVFCVVLVPEHQLIGLGVAQVLQALFMSVAAFGVLKYLVPGLSYLPIGWDRPLFMEMLSYGINFQVRSVTSMLYDPTTKAILTKFGGLQMVGFYEMASRMIMQFRALMLNANKVMVPTIAHVYEKDPGYVQSIYRESYRLMMYISVPLFAMVAAFAPLISLLWIGRYERLFVIFTMLLSAGWFVNLQVGPSYFANMGIGELRWNTTAHLTIGVLNGLLGAAAGFFYGGVPVVAASIFSLVAGSAIIPLAYHSRHSIPIRELFPKEMGGVLVSSIAAMAITLLLYYSLSGRLTLPVLVFCSIFSFVVVVALPVWRHPMRARLMGFFGFLRPKNA